MNRNKLKYKKLCARCVLCGISLSDLAVKIGMHPATIYRRVHGETPFTVDEVKKIGAVLGIVDDEEFADIFLRPLS